jgi:transposase
MGLEEPQRAARCKGVMKTYILTNPMAVKRTVEHKDVQRVSEAGLPAGGSSRAEVIYLGIDVHLRWYVVCRKVDGAAPQPGQRFSPEEFMLWAVKQKKQAQRVVCCYEAGPFGYVLHRQLEAMGIKCLVVRPENWDDHGRNVKTDGRDACALVEGLARYENGNTKALAIVRVPAVEEEQRRALSRQREALVEKQRSLGAWGKSQALNQGIVLKARQWWKPKAWKSLQEVLPPWLAELLEAVRKVLLSLDESIASSTRKVEAMALPASQRPKGLGALTQQILNNEAVEWSRFKNRRQVSSYTGLCPSEYSSGGSRRQGSVNKHGNRRLRAALVEAAWRLMRMQPKWKRLEKIKARLEGREGQRVACKKKLVVKLARELAVDLWRWQTGRASLKDLGLQPAA